MKKYVLLTPGPVTTSQRIKNALLHCDISHRDEDYSNILNEIREKLINVFKADDSYTTLMFTGSSTASIEAVISSCVLSNEKILVISNGAFGERISEIASVHNLLKSELKYKWGEKINVNDVERMLKKDPLISIIAMVHHETSIGILNPISNIGKLASKYNKQFIVDCVSSICSEDIDVKRDNLSVCIGSTNKCLHSIPGLSYICIKNDMLNKIKGFKSRTFYLDLYKHFKYAKELNQTPYTPSISACFALNEALNELFDEGLENRIKKYKFLSRMLREGLENLNLKFILEKKNMSNSVTTVLLPEFVSFKKLFNKLKKRGFIIYGAKEQLKDKAFQVANMGNISEKDIKKFLIAFEKSLEEIKKNV